jgi:hypothetical protein
MDQLNVPLSHRPDAASTLPAENYGSSPHQAPNAAKPISPRTGRITRCGYFRQSGRRLRRRWENWSATPSFSMDEPSEVTILIGVPAGADPRLWFFLIYATFFISGCHFVCGFVSISVGKCAWAPTQTCPSAPPLTSIDLRCHHDHCR